MNRRDDKQSRQCWSCNPLVSESAGALAQAVYPLLDWALLRKNIVSKFNDKGRPENVSEWVNFQCIITQNGARSSTLTSTGERSSATFTVMYLKPAKLNLGDIIKHRTFGLMKIVEFNGLTEMGLTSAKAESLDGGLDIVDGDSIRNIPRNIL